MNKLTLMEQERLFIGLCSDTIQDIHLTDRALLRKHNKAHTKMHTLLRQVNSDEVAAERFFMDLMENPDPKVRQSAAEAALAFHACTEQALGILRPIAEGSDANAAFHAGMAISVWENPPE